MAFSVRILEPDDRKVYENLVDILGPIGKPALDKLCEAVYHAGMDEEHAYSS